MTDIYEQIAARLQRCLAENGLPADRTARISAAAIDAISKDFGGSSVYLPRRSPWFSRSRRDAAIRQAFTGRNMRAVCARFSVSKQTVYRALKRVP